ncbi:MAG TPA: GAF domain-containing protein [Phycisphaerales bacterium]|nr:GAF domain-containing protein [Phycisphaerales bacterium]HMP37330.1 GAF domain-containing protein [Phycisphaerales bacterium]
MRDYDRIAAAIGAALKLEGGVGAPGFAGDSRERERRMAIVVAAAWSALREQGVSWLGFYVAEERAMDPTQPIAEPAAGSPGGPDRLILSACAPRPACSPIGTHGVCGQALLGRTARIVRDVSDLGPDYIACDPRDRSEVVVPLFDEEGRAWAVLDLDSHDLGAFDDSDAAGLHRVLAAAGLTARCESGETPAQAPATG